MRPHNTSLGDLFEMPSRDRRAGRESWWGPRLGGLRQASLPDSVDSVRMRP
jgi:hypothetical protein